jgi:hypothetical protein
MFTQTHGARNWPFFTFTTRPVFCGGFKEIGLAAEKSEDLPEIDVFRSDFRLFRGVDVGGNGNF